MHIKEIKISMLANNNYTVLKNEKLFPTLVLLLHLSKPTSNPPSPGNGKTASVQHLANRLGKKLVVVNMSQQSDPSDLVGG